MSIQRRVLIRSIIAGLLFTCASVVEAQVDAGVVPGPAARKPASLCWWPRPESRCRSYLVTQIGAEQGILSTSGNNDLRFVATVGPMINHGPTEAWGILASASTSDPDGLSPSRLEARYRRWLGSSSGVDLGIGYTRHSAYGDNGALVQLRGLTAGIGIEQGIFGVDARLDVTRGGGRTEAATFVGARVGGYMAPLAAASIVVGYFALFALAYAGG